MAAKGAGLLPLYQRYLNGFHIPLARKSLRLRKKYILLFFFATGALIFMFAFYFLPNFQEKSKHVETPQLATVPGRVFVAYQTQGSNSSFVQVLERSQTETKPSEKLDTLNQPKLLITPETADHIKTEIQHDKELFLKKQQEMEEVRKREGMQESEKLKKDHLGYPGTRGGAPADPAVRARRDKVREMMQHAWHNYKKYGWGANEHKPVSLRPHMGSIFGASSLGATIVDSLDTLYIMELNDEFNISRDWITLNLNFDVSADLSVFETNIRFVGGLLSAYAFTGDQIFKNKAIDVADRLLPAFNTQTGLPLAIVNFQTGSANNYGWTAGGGSILSEVGSLHLEFDYLSTVTGDSLYRDKVMKIRTFLKELEKPDGLYPNLIHPRTGKWGLYHVTMGGMGDSFYEYLLKQWLISNRSDTEARQMYDDAMKCQLMQTADHADMDRVRCRDCRDRLQTNKQTLSLCEAIHELVLEFSDHIPPLSDIFSKKAVLDRMLVKSPGGLTYFAEFKSGRLEHKMDHLACFSAGMVGLGAEGSSDRDKYVKIGEELANTCHESYARTATGLGPEAFHFEGSLEAQAIRHVERAYVLRPEAVEGWFYLWRITKKQKYRDWAWSMVQALEKHCRVDGGYSGIVDVYQASPIHDDVQQSFFLAETLKYLYLIFSEDSLLPLDQWVFNTEAHPLPVKGLIPFSGSV